MLHRALVRTCPHGFWSHVARINSSGVECAHCSLCLRGCGFGPCESASYARRRQFAAPVHAAPGRSGGRRRLQLVTPVWWVCKTTAGRGLPAPGFGWGRRIDRRATVFWHRRWTALTPEPTPLKIGPAANTRAAACEARSPRRRQRSHRALPRAGSAPGARGRSRDRSRSRMRRPRHLQDHGL